MALAVRPPVAPMLARLVRTLPTGDDLVYEPKWDGFRCLAFREGPDVDLRSRHGRPFARYFPEVVEACAALPRDVALDGELVVARADGALDFPALLARLHPARSRVERLRAESPACFVLFDLLALDAADLRAAPFVARRAALESLLGTPPPGLALTPQTADAAEAGAWLARPSGQGIDGVVVRSRSGRYESGRRAIVKVKGQRTADCVVAGFRLHPDGGVGSLLLGLHDDAGDLRHVGVASSFAASRRAALLDHVRPHVTSLAGHPWERGFGIEPSPLGRLRGAAGRWTPDLEQDWVAVRPTLVCEVAYGQVDAERFRHPARFERWRPDRDAASCSLHQLADGDPVAPSSAPAPLG